tara:strand:+ start:13541 stop:14101 length:561 start_codon:yes stop_codon:yes gene_type:complete
MINELELILKACEQVTQLDLKKKTREQEYVFGRSFYYYMAREKTNYSLQKIADLVGRNHATVVHGLKIYRYNLRDARALELERRLNCILPSFTDLKNTDSELNYLYSRNNRLEYLLIKNKLEKDALEFELNNLANDIRPERTFLDEIAELPADIKQEFEKYKWEPFKKMQESRKHYDFKINEKRIY